MSGAYAILELVTLVGEIDEALEHTTALDVDVVIQLSVENQFGTLAAKARHNAAVQCDMTPSSIRWG